jgi:hypothetical protein
MRELLVLRWVADGQGRLVFPPELAPAPAAGRRVEEEVRGAPTLEAA